MMIEAFASRVPPAGWRPDGWTPPSEKKTMISEHHVHLKNAHKTPQFGLIWWVLCLNASAGIGVIGMASPMLQEIFAGKLIGMPHLSFSQLSAEQRTAIAGIAAGFAGLLSLFNIGGRFFWASLSDYIARENTYYCFFLIGIALYALAPTFSNIVSKSLFVAACCIILSMYVVGFSSVSAYLFFFFQAEDGIRDLTVTGVQTCALPICRSAGCRRRSGRSRRNRAHRDRAAAPRARAASRCRQRASRKRYRRASVPGSDKIGRASCRERV